MSVEEVRVGFGLRVLGVSLIKAQGHGRLEKYEVRAFTSLIVPCHGLVKKNNPG